MTVTQTHRRPPEQPIALKRPPITDGLVGAWGFQRGDNADDVSGNGNHGTLEGGAYVDRDGAFVLDGTGDVDVGTDASLNTPQMSVSLWAQSNVTSLTASNNIFLLNRANTSAGTFALYYNNITGYITGQARLDGAEGTDINVETGVSLDDCFHHYLIVYDGSGLELYVDNVLSDTTPVAGSLDQDSFSAFLLGTHPTVGTTNWDGPIKEAMVFNRALSESERQYIYQQGIPDDDLVLHVAGDGKDKSRYRHETTLNGGVIVGKEMVFDGTDGYVTVADDDSQDLEQFTVVHWVRGNAAPDGSSVVQTITKVPSTTGTGNYIFSWDHTSSEFAQAFAYKSGNTWVKSKIAEVLAADTWYFIVGTYDGHALKVYLNGELSNSTPSNLTPSTGGANPLYIGANLAGISLFDGSIDNIRIYKRPWTIDEPKINFNLEKGRYGL